MKEHPEFHRRMRIVMSLGSFMISLNLCLVLLRSETVACEYDLMIADELLRYTTRGAVLE